MMSKVCLLSISLYFLFNQGITQNIALIEGTVVCAKSQSELIGAKVFLKKNKVGTVSKSPDGYFSIKIKKSMLPDTLVITMQGYQTYSLEIYSKKIINIALKETTYESEIIEVKDNLYSSGIVKKLRNIVGTSIYHGKKTELINLSNVVANTSANTARQVFSSVAGLNIWDGDNNGGLQLNIGGRGLSPRRTSNFNVKQNGYDIAADAIGYPESYYTPPAEATEKVEFVRGAASLQYGTQFGGLVNFHLKTPEKNKPFTFTWRQSFGSFEFSNLFLSASGTLGNIGYFLYYNHRKGNGSRPNANFESHNAFATIEFKPLKNLFFKFDYTFLSYLAKMPGGLTDRQFYESPAQSFRNRNWFRINWNVFALKVIYDFSIYTILDTRSFALYASRESIGNLIRADRHDPSDLERDYLIDNFLNIGNETRLLSRYQFFGMNAVFLVGERIYWGSTKQQKGKGNTHESPDFFFIDVDYAEPYEYRFPSFNAAFFVENIIYLTPNFSLSPGARIEYIESSAKGNFTNITFAGLGEGRTVVNKEIVKDSIERKRIFVLLGIGASYKPTGFLEIYSNISQNYRGVTFNDLRINNENFRINPNLRDESGFNADLGIRGNLEGVLYYDLTLFSLFYSGKIGTIFQEDEALGLLYRYRTNISDALTLGIEAFFEIDLMKFISKDNKKRLAVFSNIAWLSARYLGSKNFAFENKYVEFVSPLIFKSGLTVSFLGVSMSLQYAYTHQHYTDATNADITPSGIEGIIPSYGVMDISLSYKKGNIGMEASLNNVLNISYFTTRVDGYPGPGIIPSDKRSFTFTFEVNL